MAGELKKVITVDVYQGKNVVKNYGFMAGDKNTPVMEVNFRDRFGADSLEGYSLRYTLIDNTGSLLIDEATIGADNIAVVKLPNELFEASRKIKVQLAIVSADDEQVANINYFVDSEIRRGLVEDDYVEPVYEVFINKINDHANEIVKGNLGVGFTTKTEPIPASRIPSNDIPSSKLKTSTDADRIQPYNLSDAVKSMMTGDSPVSPVIGDKEVTTEKLADGAVNLQKINKAIVTDAYCSLEALYCLDGSKSKTERHLTISFLSKETTESLELDLDLEIETLEDVSNLKIIEARIFATDTDGADNIMPLVGSWKSEKLGSTHKLLLQNKNIGVSRTDAKWNKISIVQVYNNDIGNDIKANVKNLKLKLGGVDITSELEIGMFNRGSNDAINYDVPVLASTKYVDDSIKKEISGIEFPEGIVSGMWGKKWLAIGDSITAGYGATERYTKLLSEKNSCTEINVGISGSGYATDGYGAVPLYTRISSFVDNSVVDFVTLFYGTNDWNNLGTLPIGTVEDTGTTTFCGCVYTALKMLTEKYYDKPIMVFTPLPRNNDRVANSRGEYLKAYVDAIISISSKFSLPICDLYRNSNFYSQVPNFKSIYMPDGLHPNDAGHILLAKKFEKFIDTIL